MWRIDITRARREVDILDLQVPDGPAPLPASAVLPLCTVEFVLETLELAVDSPVRDLDALIDRRAEALEAGAGTYPEAVKCALSPRPSSATRRGRSA